MGYIRRGYAKSKPTIKRLKKYLLLSALAFFGVSLITVGLLRWVPVYVTPLVILRTFEYAANGKWTPLKKNWVTFDQISIHLQKAVIASEDPKFLSHNGFDFNAILKAIDANKHLKVKIGASTITQQTAKNVFLYPSRTYLRKVLEAFFTILMETMWGKKRILEVYLNVVELGPGIYGAEAAAQHYWKKSAKQLTLGEAQLIAAILPNPRRWSPKHPTNFILKRRNFIRRNLVLMGKGYFGPLTER